jgi:hypothetical protein
MHPMGSPVQIGVLATLALHILLLGGWWLQTPYLPDVPLASQAESVLAVSLLAGNATDVQELDNSTTNDLPALSTAIPEERVHPSEQEATALNLTPVLPFKEAPYIPAGELDERPFTETPVILPFPNVPLESAKVTGVLVLYIGTNGYVDRIEVDESDLPPEFEKAAIDTFLQARMRPGMKDGNPIRARMKILVEFEQR